MPYWHDRHMDNAWGFWMVLGMLGIWALVVVGIVLIVRLTRTPGAPVLPPGAPTGAQSGRPTGGAEQILAERLARGEIDVEEYRQRRDALNS